jgi:hypothetical protein
VSRTSTSPTCSQGRAQGPDGPFWRSDARRPYRRDPLIPHIKQGKQVRSLSAAPNAFCAFDADGRRGRISGFETPQWYGILAPAGTPDAIVRKLSAEINRILKSPEVVERMTADGSVPQGSTPEEFAKFIAGEQKRWGQVVKAANIKPD